MDDRLNKIDELENIEEEDLNEIDWWDMCVVMLKQTHPFSVVQWYNRFCPMHIRLTSVYTELLLLILVTIIYLD